MRFHQLRQRLWVSTAQMVDQVSLFSQQTGPYLRVFTLLPNGSNQDALTIAVKCERGR